MVKLVRRVFNIAVFQQKIISPNFSGVFYVLLKRESRNLSAHSWSKGLRIEAGVKFIVFNFSDKIFMCGGALHPGLVTRLLFSWKKLLKLTDKFKNIKILVIHT